MSAVLAIDKPPTAADLRAVKFVSAILLVGGRYALQLRDEGIEIAPGMWGLFGGHLEPYESPLAALRREIIEELEIELHSPALFVITGPLAVYVADVMEQWPRRVLHEGQRDGVFAFQQIAGLRRPKIVAEIIGAHYRGKNGSRDQG